MANVHDKVGNLLAATRQTDGALEHYQEAMKIREAIVAADPNNAEIKRDLSISHEKIGNMFARLGDPQGALAQFRQALEIDTILSVSDPQNAQTILDRASSLEKIGDLLMKSGDLTGALDSHHQARQLREEVAGKDQKNVEVRSDLAFTYQQIAAAHVELAQKSRSEYHWLEAKNWYQRCLDVMTDLQNRGALKKDDEAEIERIKAEIRKCDEILK